MKISSILALMITSILACAPAPDNNQSDIKSEPKSEISDDLIMRLSMEIYPNPSNQKELDQNLILNYAIDHNLDIQRTQNGLYFLIENAGEGDLLQWGDRISAKYTGQFLDGKVFDSTARRNEDLTFYIGNMIPGWNEGLQLLRPNGKATFLIPSHLAYGEKGIENLIPPNRVLRFDLEVTELIEAKNK